MEELPRRDCLEFLSGTRVGRLGVSIRALPVILPVNFVLVGSSILVRTATGSDLLHACADEVVAFEADGFESAGAYGWSVLVRGIGEEIVEAEQLTLANRLGLESWALRGRADRFVAIPTTIVSGRRFLRVA
jgi:nitroimidazol reductase NimA-like FMN-containing flavoprotein (pyridoxamine 5'-phosphate oxidase superfamily)